MEAKWKPSDCENDVKTVLEAHDLLPEGLEHGNGIDLNVVNLARNADLLIHDAQYTPEELKEKKGWGHSSWEQAIA